MTNMTRNWRLALAAMVTLTAGSAGAADISPQTTFINEELAKDAKAVEIKFSKKASDYEFVRRVFIDIVGRIPTAEEVKDFAEVDGSANKRAKLVHRLLYEKDYHPKVSERVNPKDPKSVITYDYSGEYARNYSNIWGIWLMTRGGVAKVYHDSWNCGSRTSSPRTRRGTRSSSSC